MKDRSEEESYREERKEELTEEAIDAIQGECLEWVCMVGNQEEG